MCSIIPTWLEFQLWMNSIRRHGARKQNQNQKSWSYTCCFWCRLCIYISWMCCNWWLFYCCGQNSWLFVGAVYVCLLVCTALRQKMNFFSSNMRRIQHILVWEGVINNIFLIFMPAKNWDIFEHIKSFLTYRCNCMWMFVNQSPPTRLFGTKKIPPVKNATHKIMMSNDGGELQMHQSFHSKLINKKGERSNKLKLKSQ